jgi:hypothetical protein
MLDAVNCNGSQASQCDSGDPSLSDASTQDLEQALLERLMNQNPSSGSSGDTWGNSGGSNAWSGGSTAPSCCSPTDQSGMGGMPPSSSWGNSQGTPITYSSGSTPQLTGNISQDVQTLNQLVSSGAGGDALQNFATLVAGEAAKEGDQNDAEWAIDIASGINSGSSNAIPSSSDSWSPPLDGGTTALSPDGTTAPPLDGGTTAPSPDGTTAPPLNGGTTAPSLDGTTASPLDGGTTAPPLDGTAAPLLDSGSTATPSASGGDEATYQSDLSQANTQQATATQEFLAADADTDPSTQAASFQTAEQDEQSAASDYAEAASEATTDVEANAATDAAGRALTDEATLIANSGQAGPGGSQQAQYDSAMEDAESDFDQVASDPADPRSVRDAALENDADTLQQQTDNGDFNSATYQAADQDLTNTNIADGTTTPPPASASTTPPTSDSTTPPTSDSTTPPTSGPTIPPASNPTPPAASSSNDSSFPNGNDSDYQADMNTAAADAANAQSVLANLESDPVAPKGVYEQAEADMQSAAQAAQKGVTDATNEAQKTYASSYEGASDAADAAMIWQSGDAGTGHSGHDMYTQLMDSAQSAYGSIADDSNASKGDADDAKKLVSDLSTMEIVTNANGGDTTDYSDAETAFNGGASGPVLDANPGYSFPSASGTTSTN